jgi:lipid II:glycine glycyltransferase (peptidoglycan interpeptide bridge formation enzyme)
MTFTRQGRDIPYSFELIENLYKICKKNNACKMFFAKDENNEVIAGNFLVYDEHTVYYLMGGIDPDKKDLGGMDIVQHKSIAFALENNLTFDFEGSMVESIEKYFRSFGATQKPYFQISKTNSKLLKFKDSLRNILK